MEHPARRVRRVDTKIDCAVLGKQGRSEEAGERAGRYNLCGAVHPKGHVSLRNAGMQRGMKWCASANSRGAPYCRLAWSGPESVVEERVVQQLPGIQECDDG